MKNNEPATSNKRKSTPAPTRLDQLDLQLVDALQRDARLSIRELGRRLGVSAPTVSDRLSRLEAAGVIRSYGAVVSLSALGYGVVAFVGVFDTGEKFSALDTWAKAHPAVLECHHVTGRFAALMKIAVPTIEELNSLVMELVDMGVQCDTSIVLSSPVPDKMVTVQPS